MRYTLIFTSLSSFFVPFIASAETFKSAVNSIISSLGQPIVNVLIGLSLVAFFWGLALYTFSAGATKQHERGRQIIIWGIIGIFAALSIWGFINILGETFFGSSSSYFQPTYPNLNQ